ncbi:hypothetical protein [Parapedobacter sp. DT-150]|uniref:hypothetical protein n=1 Tax=Parapedobacter sp. DT-150 TaxID=3396162 RepID=UPI003F1C775F
MKRAYRTAERNHAKGIDNSVYRHLYYIPNGFSLTEKNYDKQLEKVKRFLLKATDRFLRFRLASEEERGILQCRKILLHSSDEDVVYDCIVNLLEATQRFK